MIGRTLMVSLLVSSAVIAQDKNRVETVIERLGSATSTELSLDDLFRDIGDLVRSADRSGVATLAERLRMINQELAVLEGFQERSRGSGFVEMPVEILRGLEDVPANREMAASEEARVSGLRIQLGIEREKLLRRREEAQRPAGVTEVALGSRGAQATLATELDLPKPPDAPSSPVTTVLSGADHRGVGRALFLKGDWAGALIAFERIEVAKRTADVLYRMARCNDLLEDWDAAEKGYQAVLKIASDGHWRKSAEFQIGLLQQKRKVREMLGKASATQGENR